MPKHMPDRMPKYMVDRMLGYISKHIIPIYLIFLQIYILKCHAGDQTQ